MLAAYIDRLGPAAQIRHGPVPEPRPGPTDVLVEVIATTVNPVDTFVRSGVFATPMDFPFVIGRDLVGRVAEAGAGFGEDELVWCNSLGHGGRQGAAAERAVVPAERLYRLPGGVDPIEAVAVVHPGATAYLALFTHGDLHPGETVLVLGGGGNVGSALITLAVEAGATVVATASARDIEHCRSLGAAEVFDYRDPSSADRLRGLGGVDLHLDSSGTNDLDLAVDLLAFRGRVVLLAGARSTPVLPAGRLYMKDCSIRGFVISHATSAELAEAAVALNRLMATGRLRPRAVERFPLTAAASVHTRLERGELRGRRAVLIPG